jgi:uncharacterized protein (TIGR02001 family)
MRTRRLLGFLGALCVLLTAGSAVFAQELSTSIDLAYVSKYVWRGTVPNPDPAFQPSITISHPSGASFNFWGSMDTTDIAGNSGNFTEEDYTLSYGWEAAGHSMSAGYIYYAFPNTEFNSTQEIFYSIGIGPTSFAVNYDFDEAKGLYGSIATGYDYNITPGKPVATPMSLSAKLGFATSGYNDAYFGVDKFGLVDLVLSASAPFETKKLTITPSLSYSTVINSDISDALSAGGVDKNNFIAGLTVSAAF